MNILIGCETSGISREAFRAKGHNVTSCDLLPSEDNSPNHIQDDIFKVINFKPWDMMIAHPTCTFLTLAGVRWLYLQGKKENGIDLERVENMYKGAKFFKALQGANITKIALENPIPHSYAELDSPTQIIQPWMFGHGEIKATCLWLKNLPRLIPTNIVSGRSPRVHYMSPGPNRWKERSRTLTGIALAMAEQWG